MIQANGLLRMPPAFSDPGRLAWPGSRAAQPPPRYGYEGARCLANELGNVGGDEFKGKLSVLPYNSKGWFSSHKVFQY